MDNGEIIYENFYRNLYQHKKSENVDFDLKNELSYEDIPKLLRGIE